MNVPALVLDRIVGALKALQGEGVLPAGLDVAAIEVAPPRDARRGDLSSNAALILAKAAGMKPREVAARLAEKLRGYPDTETVEVAGAGFVNLRFAPRFWQGVVAAILTAGSAYGRADLGRSERINVVCVSAARTAPRLVGDCRAAVLADAVASLLAFAGYEVTREHDITAADAQLDGLARSAYLHYRKALGEEIGKTPAGLHPGEDLQPVGATLAEAYGRTLLTIPEERWLPPVREAVVAAMLAMVKDDLAALSVKPDVLAFVPALVAGENAIRIAGAADLDIKVCQRVRVLRAGAPVRTPKRAGSGATLREVVGEVGCDAVRFTMLYRKHDAPLDLDLATVLEPSKDNQVFLVQYAHARTKSIFRNAGEAFPALGEGAAGVVGSDLSLLSDAGELDLIKQLALFPSLVEGAARACEPHRLAYYLYDLASSFYSHSIRGNDLPHLRSIQPADGRLTAARLALVQATAQVLAVGLELLGVFAPLEMR